MSFLTKCLPCNKKNESNESVSDKDVEVEKAPEDAGRAQWASPTEFMLTCVGYSVGLGNVWRFPYLCYKSGGGAFLIPYLIMLILIGMPLLFMEYAFGQYFGVGSLSIFKKVCPMFTGVGIGYMVLNGLVCIYYNVIIAISLYYLFASFQANLPWSHCNNEWNTPGCDDEYVPVSAIKSGNDSLINGTSSDLEYNLTSVVSSFASNSSNITEHWNKTSPSDEYFKYALLNLQPGIDINNLGQVQWKLCLCLLLAWVLVVIFVSRGIKSTGKVAYFTATFPYLMLTVLVVRGCTLEGAAVGIKYFIMPDWAKLKEPEVWFGAASQLFYSTNLAWGGMITMASYNSFNHNCFRDAIVINFVSFFTSMYAGIAVFAIIGYMANRYGIDVKDVIDSGPGLAFIVYPRALSLMPLAPMWSALFFFMLFLLGIGSQMVGMETVMSGLCDEFPILRKNRMIVLITVASAFFLFGVPQVTQGGMYVLQLMDWYSAGFSVLVIAIVECCVINWIYGNTNFSANVKEMLGRYPPTYWRICWKFVSPLIILGILVFSFVKYVPAKYGEYYYPAWADTIGWIMALASVLPIFIVATYKFIKAEGSGWREKFANATAPQLDRKSIEEKPEVEMKLREEEDEITKLETVAEDLDGTTHGLLVKNNANNDSARV